MRTLLLLAALGMAQVGCATKPKPTTTTFTLADLPDEPEPIVDACAISCVGKDCRMVCKDDKPQVKLTSGGCPTCGMDVPAIQTTRPWNAHAGHGSDVKGELHCSDWTNMDKCMLTSWTCAEKSRILLTAEDGTRHCIKFPK